jgi:calcineurin-like phosphoesterase
MRLIFIGDVVGKSGREAVAAHLPSLRERHSPDVVVVNGENAAHGFGITEDIFNGLRDVGADVVTLGNHAFDQREALVFIEREERLIRPCNWNAGCPGRGSTLVTTSKGQRTHAINARHIVDLGRSAGLSHRNLTKSGTPPEPWEQRSRVPTRVGGRRVIQTTIRIRDSSQGNRL